MKGPRVSAAAPAAIALLAALTLWYYAGGGRVAYTMDSLTYRDAALNLLAGHSLAATNVSTEVPEHVPLLQWPPAYPVLWAAGVFWLGADIDQIPHLLAPVLLSLTVLVVYWCALLLSGRAWIAALVAVAGACTPSSMAVFGHAWSETLFLPLLLAGFAALLKFRDGIGTDQRPLLWLIAASACIGLANWARYSGAIFLPVLALSAYTLAGPPLSRRIRYASIAAVVSCALVAPLWWRNYQLTGTLSGSERGGMARYPFEKLRGDIEMIWEMFEHSLFNFDMLLRAHLEIPMLAIAVFLLARVQWRSGVAPLRSALAWLPLAWAGTGAVFLLYARMFQRDVDLDFRMLATIMPFLLLTCVPLVSAAFSARSSPWLKGFVALVLGLVVNTGLQEAQRVHANYAENKAPGWRARFGIVYRDLTPASSTTRALQEAIGELPAGTLVLTDYRALYIRYLTGARAYAAGDTAKCLDWQRRYDAGVLLTGYSADDGAGAWMRECGGANQRWPVIRVSGQGAHSLVVSE